VLAASYPAKARGIKTRMALWEAKQLSERALFQARLLPLCRILYPDSVDYERLYRPGVTILHRRGVHGPDRGHPPVRAAAGNRGEFKRADQRRGRHAVKHRARTEQADRQDGGRRPETEWPDPGGEPGRV